MQHLGEPPMEIVKAAIAGEEPAYTDFWNWVSGTIYRVTNQIGPTIGANGPEDRDDMAQYAAMHLLEQSPESIAGIRDWRPWLRRFARCRCIDWMRKEGRHRGLTPLDAPLGGSDWENAALKDFIASNCHADMTAELDEVWAFIESLGKENAAVFRLYIDGWKQWEIAELCNLKQAKVNTLIYRVRQAVLKWLGR